MIVSRFKVYSLLATTKEQFQALWDVYTSQTEGGLDFWTKPAINAKTDVMVPPAEEARFLALLQKEGINYETKIDDVQS